MKIYRLTILVTILSLFISCNKIQSTEDKDNESTNTASKEKESTINEDENNAIKVFNFATFHMGGTTDAISIDFDANNKKNVDSIHQIAEMLSSFKPTIILVERTPEYNNELQNKYSAYLDNPNIEIENPSEVELLAFEIGRLSGVKNIYGIDHKLNYNYRIASEIENAVDSVAYTKFQSNPFKFVSSQNPFEKNISIKDKLMRINHPEFLDFLIKANADILTYVGTENGFEGADEASKYYQRNLRIYSNLHRLDLDKNDRVFILFGGSHTAFLRQFMERDGNYQMVETFDYLKK